MQHKTVHFYLVHPKKTKSPIYVRFFFEGQRLQCSTGLSIEVKNWDAKKRFPKVSISDYHVYRAHLKRVEEILQDFYANSKAKGIKVTSQDMQTHLREVLHGKHDAKSFFDYYDDFLQFKAERNTPATLKDLKSMKRVLLDFEKVLGSPITFEAITKEFEDRLVAYLRSRKSKYQNEKGQFRTLNSTISKRIGSLKLFMRWAMERGYHTNEAFKTFDASRKNDKPRGGGKNDIVVLTEEELNRLKRHDFSHRPALEKIRDIFLFATYTAQRYSDVQAFNPNDLQGNIWEFTAKKTGEITSVPLVGWCSGAVEILQKYGGKLPKISGQKFNQYIKRVCKMAGITERVKLQRFSGKELITVEGEKWEFVSSHCARRTAITILCTRGIPLNILQQLTGHDDISTLMKYVNTPKDALANWLKQIGR